MRVEDEAAIQNAWTLGEDDAMREEFRWDCTRHFWVQSAGHCPILVA